MVAIGSAELATVDRVSIKGETAHMEYPSQAPAGNVPSADDRRIDLTRLPAATPDRTIHMIGNAHLDAVWLWPWQEAYQEARATFWSAIHRLDEYPDFVFTCNQIVLLSWVEEADPDLFARIRAYVDTGRWAIEGGWWVEPDTNLPLGESLIRQGLHGQRYLADRFGRISTVGMNVDTFGHSGALPQILRGQGLDSYVFLRPGPHEGDSAETLFVWETPDGSEVLAYRIPYQYESPAGPIDWQTEKALASRDRSDNETMVFYGVGNHGGGPTKANIDSILRLSRMGAFGRMLMSSPRQYFDQWLSRGPDAVATLPRHTGDLLHHAAGCYSAHAGIKAWQQRAQFAVLAAERWAAVGDAECAIPRPTQSLDRAWKNVLFNQFHDIHPGSAIEPAYDDARDQLGESVSLSKRHVALVHNVIASQIDIEFREATLPLVIFNPHPWPVHAFITMMYGFQRNGVHVVDAHGVELPSQPVQSRATTDDERRGAVGFAVSLPALGYTTCRLLPGSGGEPADDRVHIAGLTMENDAVRVEVDAESGWITSLVLKETGIDVARGSRLDLHTQISQDRTDTWGHRVRTYAWPGTTMTTRSVRVVESGPARAIIRVVREWGATTMTEDIRLDVGSHAVRVDNELDFREQFHALKLRVPMAIDDATATFGLAFGSTTAALDGAERPGQGWVDVTGKRDGDDVGLTLVITNKHAFDVSVDETTGLPSIGVTIARGTPYAWHDPRPLDPNAKYAYQDQGIQRFSYLLIPHRGDFSEVQPERRFQELALPPRCMQESAHPGTREAEASFATVSPDSVLVTAIKPAEDGSGDLVVRAVEMAGEAIEAHLDVLGRTGQFRLGPHEIRTLRWGPNGDMREVNLLEHDVA